MTILAIHNPANGEKIADLAADDAATVAAKSARARAAQAGWAARPLAERQECIARFHDGVVRDLEQLAVTMT
ncbi:MAG: aldehyde dehydrogenase family protein, partial [Comamonadaceae bacterium]